MRKSISGMIGRRAALLAFVLPVSILAQQQKNNQGWSVFWDSARATNIIRLPNREIAIEYPFQYPGLPVYRSYDFFLVRTGDMRGLYNVEGKMLTSPCHQIEVISDSIAGGYVCARGGWIFLNEHGDTLSYGWGTGDNMIPSLVSELNAAPVVVSGKRRWGYIGKDARWKIKPKVQEAQEFKDGKARVKLNDKWGLIDRRGNFIVLPQYGSPDFEIK